MKTIVKYLYNKWFPKHSLLETVGEPVDISTLPVSEQNIHFHNCKQYSDDGTFRIIAEALSAEYLHNIVFTLDNQPAVISPAEVERAKIAAIEQVLSTVENWASRLQKKELFDEHTII